MTKTNELAQINTQDSAAYPEDVLVLQQELKKYLSSRSIDKIMHAFQIGEKAHLGQTRKSGEPYITHPVAVATILARMRLDQEAIIAALLHDTLEDTTLQRDVIEKEFGKEVSYLVDSVTKLDKVQFNSRQEANAESFRKMLLAMARDLRVILIKLADRLHNMRTLDSMSNASQQRIAQETLEIYAPIAQRLGMNQIKGELQDIGFRTIYPWRYRVLSQHLRRNYGTRHDGISRIEITITEQLTKMNIPCQAFGRIKTPYSIFTKMRTEHKTLAQVLDVYGIRIIVQDVMQCYAALGIIHSLYKPFDGRFKDFIAIPKANGYQSLHTTLFGPNGTPIEIQIRTEEMHTLAERGIAAHWAYKNTESTHSNNAQHKASKWVSGLLSTQTSGAISPLEFLENVKIDLFPDDVYLFTPQGDILALPRNATALDFAYAVHTDVGNHAVAARVDKKLVPLKTRLSSGQYVEIITAPSAVPSLAWLDLVITAKARIAIRQFLKHLQHEDAMSLGHRMLDRSLEKLGNSLDAIPTKIMNDFLSENHWRKLEDMLTDVALGNRMPAQVASQLIQKINVHPTTIDQTTDAQQLTTINHSDHILITGAERGIITFAACCHPIPGDNIIGYLSAGKGIVVHQLECHNVPELQKNQDRCLNMAWDHLVAGEFKVTLKVIVENRPGVLATVAASIADADSNIDHVEYQDRDTSVATLLFTIAVQHRKHLADVIRRVRRSSVVHAVSRQNTT